MLLAVLVGRVQRFGHLASFPPNAYGLGAMFVGFHMSDSERRWLLGSSPW